MTEKILNLENAPLSDRNGTYGGAAGSKEGILIDGEYWLVKYPQSTKSMTGDLDSYTTSPLSEYIGSHIYEILGYPVHKTKLGLRNGKLVVACKDFCQYPGELREMRTLKNIYNKQLEDLLETEISSTGSTHCIELKEILLHLDYNPVLSTIKGLKERFWDCVIIDGLINNNDRNNGNWGLLYRNGIYEIAPIFDNGSAFSSKATDKMLLARLNDAKRMESSALNTISVYGKDGKNSHLRDLLVECAIYPDYQAALRKNVPLIQEKMPKINDFMLSIPETYNGIQICSTTRASVYLQEMQLRLNKLLIPALENLSKLTDN